LSRFDPALEFRAAGKGEGVQEQPTVEVYRLREGVDPVLGIWFGTQALEGRCVGPDVVRVQPDLIIRYDQHLGRTQSGSQLGQQTAEVAAGGGFGKVRPEEKAEMLTRDGLQTGGQAEKQGANLATGVKLPSGIITGPETISAGFLSLVSVTGQDWDGSSISYGHRSQFADIYLYPSLHRLLCFFQ
jgi:hypothetical protein